jgi:hypothetical protein
MNRSISIFEHRLVLSVCSRRMGRTEDLEGTVAIITSGVPSKKTRDISGKTVPGNVWLLVADGEARKRWSQVR